MPTVEAKVPQTMLDKLDMLATVDELTRGEVIRMAIREYFEDIDWKKAEKDYEELTEEDESEVEKGEDADDDSDEED